MRTHVLLIVALASFGACVPEVAFAQGKASASGLASQRSTLPVRQLPAPQRNSQR